MDGRREKGTAGVRIGGRDRGRDGGSERGRELELQADGLF